MNERDKELALKASDAKTGWLDRQKFADLIRADEREACAKVADHMASRCNDIRAAALESAAENIRARGNT